MLYCYSRNNNKKYQYPITLGTSDFSLANQEQPPIHISYKKPTKYRLRTSIHWNGVKYDSLKNFDYIKNVVFSQPGYGLTSRI